MLQSGRRSVASVMSSGVMDPNWPPQPPNNINAAAQSVWRETTFNLSADTMPRESLPLLAVWCCLKTELDTVMLDLAQFPTVPTGSEDLKRYKVLIRVRTELTREFANLSSKLRLTPATQVRLDRHMSSGVPWVTKQEGQQPRVSSKLEAQPRNGKPWGASAGAGAGEEEQP